MFKTVVGLKHVGETVGSHNRFMQHWHHLSHISSHWYKCSIHKLAFTIKPLAPIYLNFSFRILQKIKSLLLTKAVYQLTVKCW